MNDMPTQKLCECGCGSPTPPAPKTVSSRGIKKGEPLQFIHGHNRRKSGVEYLVNPFTGCWIWQRATAYALGGYGVSYDGRKSAPAYRVIYERFKGPIPAGRELHHLCENPRCVNPEHLQALTRTEHVRLDARTKLTMDIAREIRASKDLGIVLAERYGVTPNAISSVRHNKTWRE